MKWLWLLAPGGLFVILALEIVRRHREQRDGPHFRQELDAFQAGDPQMPALALPAVRPLKGRRLDSVEKIARFQRRLGGER